MSERLHLNITRTELRAASASVGHVERIWRTRLSDLSGASGSPGTVAFLDLNSAVGRVLRDDRGLRTARDLIPDRRAAVGLMDAADELLWSTERVWRHLQHVVSWLIGAGRLFVPRQDAARVDIYYLRRPVGGSRPLQAKWVRTDLGCFDELTHAVADSADHVKAAAGAARRLAGTSGMSRRTADPQTRIPGPYIDSGSGIADQGRELV